MKIISTSYSKTEEYSSPEKWLDRISFYTGILEELAKTHTVASIERINYEGRLQQKGVAYYFIHLKNKVERFPWMMHRLIRRTDPDVVLVNGFIFPLQIIQLRLAVGKKKKIIVLHRAEKPFAGLKKWLQVAADKCVNAYLFTSDEFGKQWLENGNIKDAGKIREVIQGSSHFKPVNKLKAKKDLGMDGSPAYLWVGRLEKNKDPLTVINAFIRFQKIHPAATLCMIFQTDELLKEIKTLIELNGASEAVNLVGKVEHDALELRYNAADFLLSGSHYEGSGIAVSEAMSCGCIPLVTDIASFRKMAGNCGLLYTAGNEDSLFDTLQLSLRLNIQEQQKKVLEQFQQELSFPAIAGKIDQLLIELNNE